jgi:hypothetical protein
MSRQSERQYKERNQNATRKSITRFSSVAKQLRSIMDQHGNATEVIQESQGSQVSAEQSKRKARTDKRHRMRSTKRARMGYKADPIIKTRVNCK